MGVYFTRFRPERAPQALIEGFGSSPDGSLSTDEIIKFVDHMVLPKKEERGRPTQQSWKGPLSQLISSLHFE